MSITKTRIVPLAVCGLLFAGQLIAQTKVLVKQSPNTIFQSIAAGDDVPELKITADLGYLLENKNSDHYLPAQLEVAHGRQSTIHGIELQVRGKYRRRVCDFPPLRIKFSKKYLSSLGLEKHNKLKLVTHCLDAKLSGNENVIKEYLAYKMYELLNPNSFRVALVRLHYIDSEASFHKIKRFGILIEDTDEMAERAGGEECECYNQPLASISAEDEAVMAMFQYMIGNEDWDVKSLRNVKLVQRPDGTLLPVPYDFDFSGLVNASYAVPNSNLGLQGVTERYYLGMVKDPEALAEATGLFRENQKSITKLVEGQKGLGMEEKRRILEYFAAFYKELPGLSFLPEDIDAYHVEKR